MSVYLIEDRSHEWDDIQIFYNIIFVTFDKERALQKFNELEKFCKATINDFKWVYSYVLYEWGSEESYEILKECDNIEDE